MALLSISEPGESKAPATNARKLAVGIDLGTTNSLVASVADLKPYTIPDEHDRHLLPSVVKYCVNGNKITGHDAIENTEAGDVISSVKRLLGRGINDIDYTLPYELAATDKAGMPSIKTAAGEVSPVEVSAEILRVLAARGERALGGELEGVVITVPAYFDEAQRQATNAAAKIAGLNVLRLLSEPTAAAVAYGLDAKLEGTVIIYDLGGGTFDVSLMRLEKGVFEVLATGGDAALGGDDFDRAIINWILEQSGFSGELTTQQVLKLSHLARQAKHDLSGCEQVELSFDAWTGVLSQETYYSLVDGLIEKSIRACRRVLRDAKVDKQEITDIVMVGGSTRSPRVQQKVSEFFEQSLLKDLDPDKVVALGAAIQADVLIGNKYGEDLLLLDVIPLSLGIETMGGLLEKIIPRNTTIPVARAQEFTTFKDGQTAIALHVLQGERELVSDCRSLARFELTGIPPMVAGAARVKVTFQVDADGLMSVQAQEMSSGVEASIVVKPSFGLDDGQVEEMLTSSYEKAAEDKESRALREAQVEALRIIEALEAALDEDGKVLLDDNEYQQLLDGVETLKVIVNGSDQDQIEALSTSLNEKSVHFASLRMDSQIKTALAGKSLQEVEQ